MKTRAFKSKLSLRAGKEDAPPDLQGIAFSFSEVTDDGVYGRERFAPDCRIDYPSRVFLLRDHDKGKVLARRGKNLEIEKTAEGLAFRARLPKTPLAKETAELIREGIIGDVSVGFIEKDSDFSEGIKSYKHVELHEISVLPHGYFESGKVSARAFEKPPLPPELIC